VPPTRRTGSTGAAVIGRAPSAPPVADVVDGTRTRSATARRVAIWGVGIVPDGPTSTVQGVADDGADAEEQAAPPTARSAAIEIAAGRAGRREGGDGGPGRGLTGG
jgi:hypothetical protein